MSTFNPERPTVASPIPDQQDAHRPVRLGTRGSALALAQTAIVRALLDCQSPPIRTVVEIVQSLGDRVPDRPLAALASQGIFTEALEHALRVSRVDAVIHSAKDLPSTLPADMLLVAAPGRDDPRDCLVTAGGISLLDLPTAATIGTGSPRRIAQLRLLRPDLRFEPIRGNVDTRRRAALTGKVDAVILAAAGLRRLGLMDRHAAVLPIEVCLPQAGQGTLAIEIRAADRLMAEIFGALNRQFDTTRACLFAERAVLAHLGAGCQAPIAAYAEILPDQSLLLRGCVAALDGTVMLRSVRQGRLDMAEELGRVVAEELRRQGAVAVLATAAELT
ncbi:MAG TPA: hydroxymethylbilane synthase [Chloroflexota bacterium]|nr:hydroxymethylbilane synthase [Chloroflexota bacterium]